MKITKKYNIIKSDLSVIILLGIMFSIWGIYTDINSICNINEYIYLHREMYIAVDLYSYKEYEFIYEIWYYQNLAAKTVLRSSYSVVIMLTSITYFIIKPFNTIISATIALNIDKTNAVTDPIGYFFILAEKNVILNFFSKIQDFLTGISASDIAVFEKKLKEKAEEFIEIENKVPAKVEELIKVTPEVKNLIDFDETSSVFGKNSVVENLDQMSSSSESNTFEIINPTDVDFIELANSLIDDMSLVVSFSVAEHGEEIIELLNNNKHLLPDYVLQNPENFNLLIKELCSQLTIPLSKATSMSFFEAYAQNIKK